MGVEAITVFWRLAYLIAATIINLLALLSLAIGLIFLLRSAVFVCTVTTK